MRVRKGFVGLAAVLLAIGGIARADDTNSNSMGGNEAPGSGQVETPPPETPETPPEAPENSENPETPATPTAPAGPGVLMSGLEKIGIGKPMENAGFSIYGFIEGGYLYDTTVPDDITPAKSAPGNDIFFPGVYKNSLMLNQFDLAIERTMDLSKGNFDFGFKIEGIYGRDAFFTHSNGILDKDNHNGGLTGSDDQLDLLQAYITLGIPIGSGLTLQAGKFVDVLGVEKINPTENLFYTHSYAFGYGEPFTESGVLGSYTFTDSASKNATTVTAGFSRGWNQSTRDNNGDIDGIFQVKNTSGDFNWTANLLVGPEGVLPYGPPDHADWWFVPEGTLVWKASDQLTLTGDILYGDAPHLAQWLSLAIYSQYRFNPYMALNGRAELYHDVHGVTTGVGGSDVNYGELTAGVAINPFPDSPLLESLTLRPELRYDVANHAVYDFSKFDQLNLAIDVYYKF